MHRSLPARPTPESGDDTTRSFSMLSTFPPTECGIATFAAALTAGLIANGGTVDVVRCGPVPTFEDASVLGTIDPDDTAGLPPALDVLNQTDVAIIQHEFGLYGGPDGADVVPLAESIVVPLILVAHTVPSRPSENQKAVLERICNRADAVVVMTETASARLVAGFDVPAAKVTVIPHGAATPPATGEMDLTHLERHAPRLLTWGLLGPGKGIEWAIDAVARLSDLRPHPEYVIAGATHPKVLAHAGESYRRMLADRAASSAAAAHISFDDAYRDLASLTDLIRSADVVVLPYDSTDQVTSGVLVDAVAAGRPVVSTAFPHAVELLGTGAGLVVPQCDSAALAGALRSVLTRPGLAASMSAEARRLAPGLAWTAVATRYDDLAERLLAERGAVRP
ncbi:MAG: glycosyltransferase [Acidimicrobiales bacterium]